MRKCTICCLLFFFLTSVAWADTIATYKYQDGSMMTLVTKDINHVRMDTSPTAYMLLLKDKVYSVSQDDDGQWNVMDMEKAAAAASSMGSLFGGASKAGAQKIKIHYEKTGKKETVAGYTGRIYMMETRENGQLTEKEEVVLCDHSDLKKTNEAWMAISTRMGKMMGGSLSDSLNDAAMEAKDSGYGGMLRYGQKLWLEKIEKHSLSEAYYQLPTGAKRIEMGNMPQISDQSQSQTGKVLKQDSMDVGAAAHQEAKDATIGEVKEGVRNMFKSLFD